MKENPIKTLLRPVKRKLYTLINDLRNLLGINFTKTVITAEKYKFLVPDDLSAHYQDGDYYESNVVYFLDKIVKSYNKPVLFDVGASCGYYSVRYSKYCKQVFSFEPASKVYRFLEKNIRINALPNVTTLKIGLSNADQEKTINLYSNSANNSLFERKIPDTGKLKKIGVESIVLKNLDVMIEKGEVPVPDIIKADIEGAELEFLKGSAKTIVKHRPTIVLEYADTTSKDAGYNKSILLNAIELTDYKTYGISENTNDNTLIKADDFSNHQIANVIFIPAELDIYL